MLLKLISRWLPAPQKPAVPEGLRVYAIGDVHGRADLLGQLLTAIEQDDSSRPPATRVTVFLGDLIDRGPGSRAVVETVRRLSEDRQHVHLMRGNHEEMLLQTLEGDAAVARQFMRNGGRETLMSYGFSGEELDAGSFGDLAMLLADRFPASHRQFLDSAADSLVMGDYLFVHAGIRPEKPLAEQSAKDMRWIRGEFLDFEGELEKVVVHGHSIAMEVQEHPHRIGIDTGAFATGILTALVLEGEGRRFLQTGQG